jgi:hypothetical protein
MELKDAGSPFEDRVLAFKDAIAAGGNGSSAGGTARLTPANADLLVGNQSCTDGSTSRIATGAPRTSIAPLRPETAASQPPPPGWPRKPLSIRRPLFSSQEPPRTFAPLFFRKATRAVCEAVLGSREALACRRGGFGLSGARRGTIVAGRREVSCRATNRVPLLYPLPPYERVDGLPSASYHLLIFI